MSELCVSQHTLSEGLRAKSVKNGKQQWILKSGDSTDRLQLYAAVTDIILRQDIIFPIFFYFFLQYQIQTHNLPKPRHQMLRCRILSFSHICVCKEAFGTEAKGHKHSHPSTLPFKERRHRGPDASIARDRQNFFPPNLISDGQAQRV